MRRGQHPNSQANLRPNPDWVADGESPNPDGGSILPKELRDAMPFAVKLDMAKVWVMPPDQLDKVANDTGDGGNISGVVALARVLQEVIRKGDAMKLEMFLNRLIGKPKETIELQRSERTPTFFEAKAIIDGDFTQLPAAAITIEEL